MTPAPPPLPRWLVRLAVGADHVDDVEGDLEELFQARAAERGERHARIRYWHDACGTVLHACRSHRRHTHRVPRAGAVESMVTNTGSEVRHALRGLFARPGYAAVAVLTLALGIGANVSIFTVLNGVLLRPLPYPASERIVDVRHHGPGINMPEMQNSPGLVREYRAHARSLATIGGYQMRLVNFTDGREPQRLRAAAMTPEMFDVLATRPALGRTFADSDTRPQPGAVILTHAFWTSRFGANPGIVGQTVQLDGRVFEVVGVMPSGFVFPDADTRMYLPAALPDTGGFGQFGMTALGRLAPGATLDTARIEIEQLQQRIPEWFPGVTRDLLDTFGWGTTVSRYQDRVVANVSGTLWVLFATVGFVLLIAAANVANLFLVRAESRQREVAIRIALGASRIRVAGTFLAESLVLVAAGCAVGLVLADAGTRLLISYGPPQLPRLHEVRMDASVYAFALAISVAIAVALSLLTTMSVARRTSVTLVRDGGRGTTVGRSRHRVRQALIVGQVALALVLLTGSVLMLKSARRLSAIDPGFRTDGVITAGVSLGRGVDARTAVSLYNRVLEEVAALPGVMSTGASSVVPVTPGGLTGANFSVRSRTAADGGVPPFTMYSAVTHGYFETMGMPLLSGRAPTRDDAEASRPVAWVNRTLADRFLEGRGVGEVIRIADQGPWLEIVGVVGDVKNFGLREDVKPMVYLPMGVSGVEADTMHLSVRSDGDPLALASALRAAVDRVDRNVPLTAVRTMGSLVEAATAQTAFTMTLLTLAAALSLVLGAVGLYGVVSYIVVQRRAEIGVRLALGATPAGVRRMVLRQGVAVALAGVALGLAAAAVSTRAMASLLYEVSAHDPTTYALVAAVLTLVSAAAAYLPARRASAVDPVTALREQV